MSTLTVKLPDSLLKTIRRLAKAEGVSVNQFVSSAASEKMAAWQTLDHLRREAARGRHKDYLKFLDSAGNEKPADTDSVT
jgi:uncharacterized protein (DUF1778 family)